MLSQPVASNRASLVPLTVVALRTNLDQILESGFIRDVLLGGLPRPWRYQAVEPGQDVPALNNALYVSLRDDLVPGIRNAIAHGCRNIGAFHIGDELADCDHSFYPQVDYVIRNYWYPQVFRLPEGARCAKVQWVPNGYRFGIGPRARIALLATSQRHTPIFFSGYLSNSPEAEADRRAMLEAVHHGNLPAATFCSNGFGGGMGAAAYGGWLEDTRFALVPRGRAPETIRLFDAMELGAIPVCLNQSFLSATGPLARAPVVRLKSWPEIVPWYASASQQTPEQLNAHQQQVLQWWEQAKQEYQAIVTRLIENSFARVQPRN